METSAAGQSPPRDWMLATVDSCTSACQLFPPMTLAEACWAVIASGSASA